MTSALGFSVILIFPLLVIIGFFVLIALVIAKSGKNGQTRREETTREAESVRQLYADLERMEKRIESLETILVDEYRRAKTQTPPPEDASGKVE
jgi:phage shock protein B